MSNDNNPYVAVLITGTYRELEFLLKLFPHLGGNIKHDIFLAIRHVYTDESSRFGSQEKDFNISKLLQFSNERISICELPSIDPNVVQSNYLMPVGPTDVDRECGMLSMFHGVFTAISMLKASQRSYTHVMKTRTDYLPWIAPWVDGMLKIYEESGNKIVVDGAVTKPQRYPDRIDIPWQGSINDTFCFAGLDQFLMLWDIECIFTKVWTGIPETTLFRAAMLKFFGDDLQSKRRNDSFLNNYFTWDQNNTKQSFNLLRAGIISDELKRLIIKYVDEEVFTGNEANRLIRMTYDYIGFHLSNQSIGNPFVVGNSKLPEIEKFIEKHLSNDEIRLYLKKCKQAVDKAQPL